MTRDRYCDIRATSLQEIHDTCERHIKNIAKTYVDLMENEDITDLDMFYIGIFRDTWADLLEDVDAMLKNTTSR